MALIKCRECGHDVSTEAAACPNCGAKPKKRRLRQEITFAQAFVWLFLIGAGIWIYALHANDKTPQPKTVDADQIPDSQCIKTLSCWAERGSSYAEVLCQQPIEHLSSYDHKWTDGFLDPKFDRFKWLNKEKGTVTYLGDKIEFQNAFGAWQNYMYACDFDPRKKAVIKVFAFPGRLPPLPTD